MADAPVADNISLRERLVVKYQKLPAPTQTIVQLFSVIYEPVPRNTVLGCLIHMQATDEKGKGFVSNKLSAKITQLVKAGVLDQKRGQGPTCHPLLTEIATRDAIKAKTFDAMVRAIENYLPIRNSGWRNSPRYFASEAQFIRDARIGLYRKDVKYIEQAFSDYYRYGYRGEPITFNEFLLLVCNNPFDADWFETLPPQLYNSALGSLLIHGLLNLSPIEQPLAMLQAKLAPKQKPKQDNHSQFDVQRLLWVEQLFFRGDLATAEKALSGFSESKTGLKSSLSGWLACLRGDYEQAIVEYTVALSLLREELGQKRGQKRGQKKGQKNLFYDGMEGIFFILALLTVGTSQQLKAAETYVNIMIQQPNHWLREIYIALRFVIRIQQGLVDEKDPLLDLPIMPHDLGNSLETLMLSLCHYWADVDSAKKRLPNLLIPLLEAATQSGYRWLALEAAALLAELKPKGGYDQTVAQLNPDGAIQPLVMLIQPKAAWQLCLDALTQLTEQSVTTPQVAEKRLAWFLTTYSRQVMLEPKEQKITKSGVWSKGRAIALKRLAQEAHQFDYLTPQDRQVLGHIVSDYSYGYYGYQSYEFDDTAITALVGHPHVFLADSPTVRIDIVEGEPELLVKRDKDGWLTLQFSPELPTASDLLWFKETPTRIKVINVSADHRRIATILGKHNQLSVPESAAEQVLAAIGTVSRMVTVHSDIGGAIASAEEVPTNSQPHVHLLPVGDGLRVSILSRPFAEGGAYYPPGAGGATVIAEIEGKRLQTTRNLSEERERAEVILQTCPVFDLYEAENWEWLIEAPEDCLELLLELQALGDQIVLEWPEGEKLRVSQQIGFDRLKLNIKRQKDWFAASGEIQIDDAHVMDMQRLMELMAASPGRFVALGDGQFLALTQSFRKRLQELSSLSENHGKDTRFHPLAALALEDFIDDAGSVKADKHWKAHLKRLKEVQTLQPELPSTLKAELRDYQVEGFEWMSRLAHWGVGACLADDMGLGKTLQALAVILTRAPEGPTLVIAPTSVGMNWLEEAERFAPTLNPISFGGGDRQQLLDQLEPFDLLVCSYGLLQQTEVAEMLAQVQWQTIVLDEAQAIKNMATKRSQAAMKLQAEFKLLTTGTPIENHLGELWNLFRFINPGLLGSLDSFNQKFATPIERYQDKQSRNALKKLIQPFLLRRTKQQVLSELPSRTEIVLHVELSKPEMAFYEALRRDAIAKLTDSDVTAGAKHLQVLAEIMKLRRACCNAKLVAPDTPLPSAKLDVFSEALEELLENRHKALVFSQFVDHLRIIREYLDQQKITYQYLDGSTPAKERKKRVDAFQSGEGEVFLISLKAGGTGLNLTAADYVIHMDPWWNPAVEDQASDRAHRIGQQRPVTIYRLVTKGTIEEKIVELHQQKRDLADSLLEGTEMSGKISTDELLRLISGG
ncbi:MAG: DEAD/DEAH box helicase [Cyanobacteria bacterium P01_D01_bin.44]